MYKSRKNNQTSDFGDRQVFWMGWAYPCGFSGGFGVAILKLDVLEDELDKFSTV